MATRRMYPAGRRIGEGGKEPFPLSSSYSSSDAVSSVRRLGFIAAKMHEAIMSALLRTDDADAECFNDAFKPLVHQLLHFEFDYGQSSEPDLINKWGDDNGT